MYSTARGTVRTVDGTAGDGRVQVDYRWVQVGCGQDAGRLRVHPAGIPYGIRAYNLRTWKDCKATWYTTNRRAMSRITGLRFRGTYYSPPASTAEACVALAADHLAFAALALLGGPHWQHGAKQQANPTRCRSKHELRNLRKAKASMQRKKKCAARVRIICCRVVSVFTRSELCNRSGLP